MTYPTVPAERLKRRATMPLWLALAAMATLCAGGVAFGSFIAQPESPATNAGAVAGPGESMTGGKPTKRTEVAKAQPEVDDGVWTVGVDIPAGTYRTTANVSSSCYWEINKGEGVMDIVANDLPGGGRPKVTLRKGQTFKTSDCGTWRKS